VEPEPVVYLARDGLRIPAYLTLPPDRRADERLPVVLLPQNGPWPSEVVDGWADGRLARPSLPRGMPWLRQPHELDVWSQLLASRGYVVLQPNVRGSSGYGDRFLAAGFEQWGQAMQDDLLDGLDWLIEQGIADPERVCIAGGGYGGYAALVAAFKTPERFRCAVSFAGAADLDAVTRRWMTYQNGELAVARVQAGRARGESSPIRHVDRMALPLLIVHGDMDRSVVVDQSRSLVQALQAAGKPHRYVEQQNGDHFLSLQSQRTQFMEALDEFLRAHLSR
jgi:dipeptidyl aminopeptidase/acylaminoacyl peptidase